MALTERNFHKFVRLAIKPCWSTDTLRINVKVSEESSPDPVKVGDFICFDLGSASGDYALQFAITQQIATVCVL